MNSEKVLRKDYKKQSILSIIFIISIILCISIYYLNDKIDGGLEILFIILIILSLIISLCLISRLLSNNRMKKAIINYPENETVWSWGNNKFGQLGHGSWVPKSLPTPINYLLGFNNNKKIMFEEIACGGFHSLCLIKYRDDISWIEEDFKKIVNVVNNKNFDIISTENNNRKIK